MSDSPQQAASGSGTDARVFERKGSPVLFLLASGLWTASWIVPALLGLSAMGLFEIEAAELLSDPQTPVQVPITLMLCLTLLLPCSAAAMSIALRRRYVSCEIDCEKATSRSALVKKGLVKLLK